MQDSSKECLHDEAPSPVYTPGYCEENVYRIIEFIHLIQKEDLRASDTSFAGMSLRGIHTDSSADSSSTPKMPPKNPPVNMDSPLSMGDPLPPSSVPLTTESPPGVLSSTHIPSSSQEDYVHTGAAPWQQTSTPPTDKDKAGSAAKGTSTTTGSPMCGTCKESGGATPMTPFIQIHQQQQSRTVSLADCLRKIRRVYAVFVSSFRSSPEGLQRLEVERQLRLNILKRSGERRIDDVEKLTMLGPVWNSSRVPMVRSIASTGRHQHHRSHHHRRGGEGEHQEEDSYASSPLVVWDYHVVILLEEVTRHYQYSAAAGKGESVGAVSGDSFSSKSQTQTATASPPQAVGSIDTLGTAPSSTSDHPIIELLDVQQDRSTCISPGQHHPQPPRLSNSPLKSPLQRPQAQGGGSNVSVTTTSKWWVIDPDSRLHRSSTVAPCLPVKHSGEEKRRQKAEMANCATQDINKLRLIPADFYFSCSFFPDRLLQGLPASQCSVLEQMGEAVRFKLVPSHLFLQTFESDRSHMRDPVTGEFTSPPPCYPCISGPTRYTTVFEISTSLAPNSLGSRSRMTFSNSRSRSPPPPQSSSSPMQSSITGSEATPSASSTSAITTHHKNNNLVTFINMATTNTAAFSSLTTTEAVPGTGGEGSVNLREAAMTESRVMTREEIVDFVGLH